MKLDSEIFDKIRIKPTTGRRRTTQAPACAWPGCKDGGSHPAPMGRGREGEYFYFCMEHVREYNKGYNYFTGMSDDDVASYQQQNVTGHRPTWHMAANGATGRFSNGGAQPGSHSGSHPGSGGASSASYETWTGETMRDPMGFFAKRNGSSYYGKPQRVMHNAERKARDALDIEPEADGAQIKARYKELVKRHHPDANGGDRGTEEKLREIIQAYTYLKSAGFC